MTAEGTTGHGIGGMSMPYREENRRRMIDYVRAGEKGSGGCGRLGLEVEHLVVGEDGGIVSFEPRDGRIGVREVLARLADDYPTPSFNEQGDLLGVSGDDGAVTLEPAAQLEISIAPYERVGDVATAYRHFRSRADAMLAEGGARLCTCGYHPTHRAHEMTLIPKRRYAFMDEYFARIGSKGERMMRASASAQVSVDFADEVDAVRKLRLASALTPILAAIADNTQVFEARPNRVPLRRLQMWREVDDARCGVIPGVFDDGFGYDAYVDWLLRTPPIFVTRPAAADPNGPHLRPAYHAPTADVYADAPMDVADVEHVLSVFWPDARLKRFIEVRPADSLPEPCVLGYAALIKGLFYAEASLAAIERELQVDPAVAATRGAWPLTEADVERAIGAIQRHGHASDTGEEAPLCQVYGQPLGAWIDLLFRLAREALDDDERAYLAPLEAFAWDKPWWKPGEQAPQA